MINFQMKLSEILLVFDKTVLDYNSENGSYLYICTQDDPVDNAIIFIKKMDDNYFNNYSSFKNILIITEDSVSYRINYIQVKNIRLAMGYILKYVENSKTKHIKSPQCTIISPASKIGKNVTIESNVYIDDEVEIGDNCTIKHGCKLLGKTIIGENSIIRENSIIGGQGFGVEKDEFGNNYKIAQLGGVIIGNNVEIGALNTVVSGTINPTLVSDFTKTDDHVHIAHNCKIGKNCIITAGVILSGSVKIGDNVWIGPNSTVKNSLSIEDDTLIGIGAMVSKSITIKNTTFAGNPAKKFDELTFEKKSLEYLVQNIDRIKELLK